MRPSTSSGSPGTTTSSPSRRAPSASSICAAREDGDPAALWYGEASYKLPTNTRLTAGGYWASSGYAAPDPQAGALIGFEQKINDHLNLIADWFSGKNALGYFTPGVSVPLGNWTIYAGYSIKNGDSKGNAILFELGFTF